MCPLCPYVVAAERGLIAHFLDHHPLASLAASATLSVVAYQFRREPHVVVLLTGLLLTSVMVWSEASGHRDVA